MADGYGSGMTSDAPQPEDLESVLTDNGLAEGPADSLGVRSVHIREENRIAAAYWGGIQYRIIATFLVFTVAWVWVLVLGARAAIPLWLGLLANSVLATTFYMPMHEAAHRNIWGRVARGRKLEDAIGVLCSVPTGINFSSHRVGHMRHHAFTNDPERDPDHFTEGRLSELPVKFYGMTMLYTFLPVFALVPASRVLLPAPLRSKDEGKAQVRFWFLTTAVLVAAMMSGHGAEALLLWWLPARIQLCWLMFIFAWYPHHPAKETSRYRHTRVAVFRGSGLLIRGHDHHAIHHLYPRVPHYRLRALWKELSGDLVARGVRAEGRAVNATAPVVW